MTQTDQNQQSKIVEAFLERTVHIYGITGAEGYAVLDWLVGLGHTRIIAHDFSVSKDVLRAEWERVHEGHTAAHDARFLEVISNAAITWKLGDDYASAPSDGEIFFVIQSWFRYAKNDFLKPFFETTLAVREPYRDFVWTLTRLYFALFPGKLIAVTGSDGKTSTTRMIGTLISAHAASLGVRCIETGNDRTHQQSIADVAACGPKDFLVLEISDRQLSFQFHVMPDVAVVTNVTSNKHMDDYGGFAQYVETKGNLLRFQTKKQIAILNADDTASRETLVGIGSAARMWVSAQSRPEEGMHAQRETFVRTHLSSEANVMDASELAVFGKHNWYNAMQALLAAEAVGMSLPRAVEVLKTFKGVPHRLQPVRRFKRITYVEDSSGGNPANIPVSIQTFNGRPLVMIVGGYRQNLTVEEVMPIVRALDGEHSVRAMILFGQVAPRLGEIILGAAATFRDVHIVADLPAAIAWVQTHHAELTASQEAVVCMTPGFESFDQYKDYRVRAEHFTQLVNDLT